MEHYPKVSIIIPVYNYQQYIRECVDSCLAQTYPSLEIIVVDDGSTDNTPAILEEYGSKITYIRQENSGAAVALNKGIRLSTGEFVCWLSADDVFLPDKIKLQVQQFLLLPGFDLVYTDFLVIDSEGAIIREAESAWNPPSRALSQVLNANFINGSTVMMRKSAWEDVGGFYERIPANVDTHMWIRLFLKNYKALLLPLKLVKYRTHPGNQTNNAKLMQTYCDLVFVWAFRTIPVSQIHTGNRPNTALLYKGLKHFFAKRICTYLACYNKIDNLSLEKLAGFPVYIYAHIFYWKYISYIREKYRECFS